MSTNDDRGALPDAIHQMRRGLNALYLEVPSSVADDVKALFEAVLDAYGASRVPTRDEIMALRRSEIEPTTIFDTGVAHGWNEALWAVLTLLEREGPKTDAVA